MIDTKRWSRHGIEYRGAKYAEIIYQSRSMFDENQFSDYRDKQFVIFQMNWHLLFTWDYHDSGNSVQCTKSASIARLSHTHTHTHTHVGVIDKFWDFLIREEDAILAIENEARGTEIRIGYRTRSYESRKPCAFQENHFYFLSKRELFLKNIFSITFLL